MSNLYLPATDLTRKYAQDILSEVSADDHNEWWSPKSRIHTIFEQALIKFLNRNLDYTNLNNMVRQACRPDGPKWNPAFERTRDICDYLRADLRGHYSDIGTFGRMCVWKVPPGCRIEAHTDSYLYHRHIRRWLLFLNLSKEDTYVQFSDNIIDTSAGALAELEPAIQVHELVNRSIKTWYFLVFDTWKPEALSELAIGVDMSVPVTYLSRH